MEFEWDEQKAERNLHKHHIDFRDALQIFLTQTGSMTKIIVRPKRAIGPLASSKAGCYLVYTWREERIRMISA